jgi:hypothetical protein
VHFFVNMLDFYGLHLLVNMLDVTACVMDKTKMNQN